MRPYLITPKLMRPSNMKRFPTPGLDNRPHKQYSCADEWQLVELLCSQKFNQWTVTNLH